MTESQAHSGKQSLRVSGRGSNNWDAVDLSAASLGIEAGAKVHLSACVYVESSEDGTMAIGKAGGDYAYYAQVNVKGKEWTEISCDFEADAGVNIRFLTASDNYLGKNYCLDDVTLTITAPEKMDYSDAPQIHYTSDFTSGTDGWYARSAGGAAIETTADGLYITGAYRDVELSRPRLRPCAGARLQPVRAGEAGRDGFVQLHPVRRPYPRRRGIL